MIMERGLLEERGMRMLTLPHRPYRIGKLESYNRKGAGVRGQAAQDNSAYFNQEARGEIPTYLAVSQDCLETQAEQECIIISLPRLISLTTRLFLIAGLFI